MKKIKKSLIERLESEILICDGGKYETCEYKI